MFGIGLPEMILILVVALLIIGPKKLPEMAKSLGKGLSEFKRATTDFKETACQEEDSVDIHAEPNTINQQISKTPSTPIEEDKEQKDKVSNEHKRT
jgi:TatA/E family protein of Tat protein translocase